MIADLQSNRSNICANFQLVALAKVEKKFKLRRTQTTTLNSTKLNSTKLLTGTRTYGSVVGSVESIKVLLIIVLLVC